jgi:hydroxyacylglutathione hydrolase
VEESALRLARVGIEKVIGYLGGGILAWQQSGLPLNEVPQISVLQLHEQLTEDPQSLTLLDVRRPPEWEAGRLDQANLMPLQKLREDLNGRDRSRPIAVHCRSGYRSSIATSILKAKGCQHVMNVEGGFDGWKAQNLPHVGSESRKTCGA